MSPTSQTSAESSNGQPSPVSTTSIPTPPPPPPITRQRLVNLLQNPKQRVPYNPSANHATVLPTSITEPTSFTIANNFSEWRQAMKEAYDALMKNETWSLVPHASNTNVVDGIDFHEKFSPVVKSTTIRVVLSIEVTNNWPLRQLHVHNAFLHENLKEHGTIDNIINQLGSAFALKDLGPLNYFLGIKIVPHVSDILLSQKKYILELLQSVGLFNCNHVSSTMVTLSSLSLDDMTSYSNPVKYRQVVGCSQYVTLSRPDIAFPVNKVCQYMHAPTENHWSVVKRILRYLHGTVEHGMLIRRSFSSTLQAFTGVLWKGNPDTSLKAFSDADWAGDSDD
ncbi:integrase [Tanacetum coccineum]